jgi:hypothetical protein
MSALEADKNRRQPAIWWEVDDILVGRKKNKIRSRLAINSATQDPAFFFFFFLVTKSEKYHLE